MRPRTFPGRWLVAFLAGAPCLVLAAEPRLGDLVADLTGPDVRARAAARQLLPRQGVAAVPEMMPLLSSQDPAIAKAAFDVLMDIANEASAPGREGFITMKLTTFGRPQCLAARSM